MSLPQIPRSVRTGLQFIPPARNPWLLRIAAIGSHLYVRTGCRVQREVCVNTETLINACREMQEGKIRLIVAFRHPDADDGALIFRFVSGIVPREARKLGAPLQHPPRAYMLYGRDVPEWGGKFKGWFLPRIGAIPVYPGRYHGESIATIRRTVSNMPHPVALAPEGQVTYHNERVAALETGTAQLAFWSLEDLKKQSRTEDVVIVPVCTTYQYNPRDWKSLLAVLARIERECGLPAVEGLTPVDSHRPRLPPDAAAREKIFVRVTRVTRRIVDLAEEYYSKFYGASFPEPPEEESSAELQARIHAVCEAALGVIEGRFQIKPKGDFVQRVLVSRAVGFTRQCREDISDIASLSPVEKRMADRVSQEAWLAMRHMELVDVLEYFRTDYLEPDSPFDRFVETITDLWDIANRLEGGNIGGRVKPMRRVVRIVVNDPIRVAARWDQYKENRRRAIEVLTRDVLQSFRNVAEPGKGAVRREGV